MRAVAQAARLLAQIFAERRIRAAVFDHCGELGLDVHEHRAAVRLACVHWHQRGDVPAAIGAGIACANNMASHHAPRPHRLAGVVIHHPTAARRRPGAEGGAA